MNLVNVQRQIEPILEYLATSPLVQSELEAAKVAIMQIVEEQSLSWSTRLLRWIIKKLRGTFNMSDETTTTTETTETTEVTTGGVVIKVQDSEGTVLEGVTIDYVVNSLTVDSSTDSNGQVSISDLEAGTYTFTASFDGYDSNTASVTITAGVTSAATIALTKTTTTTEEESTVSTIEDTAKEAAAAAAITSLTTTATDTSTNIASAISAKITELTNEIKNTSSPWVKARNAIEIAAMSAALAGLVAGLKSGLEELKDKIS